MWKKRGLNQIDWAISLGIFILYLSWFFLLIRPYYVPIEEIPLTGTLENRFMNDMKYQVNKTPLIVFSDLQGSYEPVKVNMSLQINESNLAFSDQRYFTIYENNLYFLANLREGRNLFSIINSDETYEKSNIFTDLHATNYSASVASMHSTYYDGLLNSVYYKGSIAIDNFKLMRQFTEVEINKSSFFSSKIMSVHTVDTDSGFNQSSFVFGFNPRIYNKITLDPFIDTRTITVTMKIKDFPNYYADNANFGQIIYPNQCASFDRDYVFFYNDENLILFSMEDLDDAPEIRLCYSDDEEIELNITMRVEKEAEYKIYFEPLSIIPNGDFSDGQRYWEFTESENPYRTCELKTGTFRVIDSASDPYLSGDWEPSTLPVAGFGSDKANLNGSGGNYSGKLLSYPFVVPNTPDFIHVWRNFDLKGFDNHGGRPDAVYLEIVDAETEAILYTLDSWESDRTNIDHNPAVKEITANISNLAGEKVKISLNLVGNLNDRSCGDESADDDAIVQIDDVYFSNSTGGKIDPEFNFDTIMSRVHLGDYESYFGYPEQIEGLNKEKLNSIESLDYITQRQRWNFPLDRDFEIILFNQSNEEIFRFGEININPATGVYINEKRCYLINQTGQRERCNLKTKVW